MGPEFFQGEPIYSVEHLDQPIRGAHDDAQDLEQTEDKAGALSSPVTMGTSDLCHLALDEFMRHLSQTNVVVGYCIMGVHEYNPP